MGDVTYLETDVSKAWEAGFEAGVGYVFGHIGQEKLNERELERFISWLELKCPWQDWEGWSVLIRRNFVRLTQAGYDECKRSYAESREKYKDNPGMLVVLAEGEARLDEEWREIKATGTYQ